MFYDVLIPCMRDHIKEEVKGHMHTLRVAINHEFEKFHIPVDFNQK